MNEEFIIRKLLKSKIKGVDNYKHNGSTWLIFTSEKKWVIELTPQGTLWYNYYFFSEIFNFVGLDVVENQHYITKWVEDTIINPVKQSRPNQMDEPLRVKDTIQNGVKDIRKQEVTSIQIIENTIQNGVKSTKGEYYKEIQKVEYTIQNGIKETRHIPFEDGLAMEEVIQNGVKDTIVTYNNFNSQVENTIQNGVKRTELGGKDRKIYEIKDIVENGVKETNKSLRIDGSCVIEDTIQNGVKVTYSDKIPHQYDWTNQFTDEIEDIIENGVKYTEIGWSQYNNVDGVIENGVKYTGDRQGDYNLVVEDTIQNGIKHTDFLGPGRPEMIEKVIENGVKETESIASHRTWKSDEVIQNGIKETNPHFLEILNPPNFESEFIEMKRINEVNIVLENGIKETTPGGYLGFVERKGKTIHQFETAKQLYYVEDVIEYGIKKTEGAMLFDESQIDTVISDGIKETHDDVMPHTGRVEGVIKNGVKKTTYSLSSKLPNPVGDVIGNGVKECVPVRHTLYNPMDFSVEYRENHRIDDVASVLDKGIKEVQPLPAQDGNRDWGIYYYRQEVPTKPHTQYVDDVITNGIKETKPMDEWVNTERILDGVIERGEKC